MSNKIEGTTPVPLPKVLEEALASARTVSKSGAALPAALLEQVPLPVLRPGSLLPLTVAYDRLARKLEMPREIWKQTVLEPAFTRNASNPDALHRTILLALQEGFIEDALPHAQQLVKLDPIPLRAAALLGSVLLQSKRFDEALKVLAPAIEQHGENADVLVRLARTYAALGRAPESEQTLWRALLLDPNHEEALTWYVAIAAEREGSLGQQAALQRLAALPSSWLPQLWGARAALQAGDLDGAMKVYQEILHKFPAVPSEVLMQISADLIQRGELVRMLQLCEPRFDAARHGLLMGANLIAAHLELGDAPAARQILDMLYALQRPEWREHLEFWRKRIEDAERGPMNPPKALTFELLRLGNPVWAYGNPDFEALLPAKAPDATRVVLACGSGTFGDLQADRADVPHREILGRLTRFFPLFLAEELQLSTEARSIVVLPWMATGGFVLSARPWKREQLKLDELQASFVVTLHVDAEREPWTAHFSLLAGVGRLILDSWEQPIDAANPAPAALAALRRILQSLCLLEKELVTEDLAPPRGARLSAYMKATEQALAASTALVEDADNTPQAARAVFDTLLQLAAKTPRSARTRCLLVNTLCREVDRRPQIVSQYWSSLRQLQEEHPLEPGPAAGAVAASVERLRLALL